MSSNRWFLGAYAGFANYERKSAASEALYREGLLQLPHVRGIELPFYLDLHEQSVNPLLDWLPSDWDYIITALPGTMNSLAEMPMYGLASTDGEGRKAALARMKRVLQRVQEIHDRAGKATVVGIEVHSAPRGQDASAEALRSSLETLLDWPWEGTSLIVEHCDAWHRDGEFSKGFLSLQNELSAVRDLPVGIGLNWGRSVLEGRRVETIHRHIELADKKLKSLFFSGTSMADPLYGNWLDNHSAIRLDSDAPWESTGSLLTVEEIEDTAAVVQKTDVLLGLKVQPFPISLDIPQRLAFLKEQLDAVNGAYKSV